MAAVKKDASTLRSRRLIFPPCPLFAIAAERADRLRVAHLANLLTNTTIGSDLTPVNSWEDKMADRLSDDAVKLIKEQCEAFLKEEKAVLFEMNIYRWVLRGLFVVILGGSIFGIFKVQEYVDGRVASRVERQDDLYSGAVMAVTGGPRAALEKLDNFVNGVSGTTLQDSSTVWHLDKISKDQQTFFFISFISALASIRDQDVDGEFIGKSHWRILLSDRYFQQQFVISERWGANSRLSYQMAICYLKFADSKSEIETARRYLAKSTNLDNAEIKTRNWNIGLADFVLGERKNAATNLSSALNWREQTSSFRRYEPADMLLTDDWNIFARLWKKFRSESFGTELKALFIDIEDDYYASKAEKKLMVAELFNTNDKIKKATEEFGEIYNAARHAWIDNDVDTLKKIFTPQTYEYLVRNDIDSVLGDKSELELIKLVTADVSRDDVRVTVVLKTRAKMVDRGGGVVPPDSSLDTGQRTFWTFSMRTNAHPTKWEVYNILFDYVLP